MAKSTRTIYRERRVEVIRDIINILISLLTLDFKQLEKIRLDFFKKIKNELQNELKRVSYH